MFRKPSDLPPGASGVSASGPSSPLQQVEDAAPRSVVIKGDLEAVALAVRHEAPWAAARIFEKVSAQVNSGALPGEAGQAVAGTAGAAWQIAADALVRKIQEDPYAEQSVPEAVVPRPQHAETVRRPQSTVDLTGSPAPRPATATPGRPATQSPAHTQKLVNPAGFFK